MNEQESVVYSAYVGIDWADSNHDANEVHNLILAS